MTIRETAFYRVTLFLSLISICIIAVDRPLAIFIETHLTVLQQPFREILSGIEIVSESTVSRYIVAALVLIIGIFFFVKDKDLHRARFLFFVGGTLLSGRLVTLVLKKVFERNRPFVFLDDPAVRDFFGSGDDSFPSGHATNYFGFFLPLVVLFPRFKWALLVLPVFIGLQRIIVNEHYISDVLAGILIASLMTLLFQRIFKIHPPSLFLPPKKTI